MTISAESLFLPDYDDVTMALFRAAVDVTPAELHGILTALVCMHDPEFEEVLQELIPADLEQHAAQSVRETSNEIFQVSGALLEDENFIYDLLLPTDETALPERLAAITQWCDGFLIMINQYADELEQTPEITEAIQAVSEIANLDTDSAGDQEAEQDYCQLVEFLRMSVILIYEDIRLQKATGGAGVSAIAESAKVLH